MDQTETVPWIRMQSVPLPIVKTKKGVVFGGLVGSFLALLSRDRRNRPHKASYTPGIHVVFPCCKDRNTPLALPSPLLQFRSSRYTPPRTLLKAIDAL